MILITNNASSRLQTGISDSDLSLTVYSGEGVLFPNPSAGEYFFCTLENSSGDIEIVKVTARSTDTFTIVRAQQGTSATAFSAGALVEARVTSGLIDEFCQLNKNQDINSHKEMQDSKELRFGTDNDARIYHDGSNYYLLNGVGNTVLTIPSGASLQVNPNGGTESGLSVASNGAVSAYHDNVKVFETHADGIKLSQTGDWLALNKGGIYCGDGSGFSSDDEKAGVLIGMYNATGGTLSAGKVVYQTGTGDAMALADADAAATMPAVGILIADTANGAVGKVLTHGLYYDATNWAWTPGALIYVSTTTGELSGTAPSGSADMVQVFGIAINADTIFVCPSLTMVGVA